MTRDVELIVKIPEDLCTKIYSDAEIMIYGGMRSGKTLLATLLRAIRNGVLLPKGHGDLIDADEFLKENKDYTGWILCSDAWGGENAYKDTLEDLINDAPTIIEADRSEE